MKSVQNELFYIYGKHASLAALNNPERLIKKILCTETILKENQKIISKHNYELTDINNLNKLLGAHTNHQGIAVLTKSIFLDSIPDLSSYSKIAILDQITDSQNLGAIIRSAASFGIDALILPENNSVSENGTVAKTSAGTIELLPIIKVINLKSMLDILKKAGFWIVGLDGEGKDILGPKILSGKIAVVLGSEDKGIRRLIKENCDYLAKIPISDKVESLNVSNAAAITFYLMSV